MSDDGVAVLASGGLDSAVLTAEFLGDGRVVQPIYIRFGLAWEATEEDHLRRFLGTLPSSELRPLVALQLPVADTYGSHWSLSAEHVPDADTPDEAVYLPGRNLLLLAKSSIWCTLHGYPTIALGTLKGNPFADSSREFFGDVEALVHTAVDHQLEIATPFSEMHKDDVIRRGRELGVPLALTLSCMNPIDAPIPLHCGQCSKCRERRDGFRAAGVDDLTAYAQVSPR